MDWLIKNFSHWTGTDSDYSQAFRSYMGVNPMQKTGTSKARKAKRKAQKMARRKNR